MSKAFTRESDEAPEPPVRPRPPVRLPPGTKIYLTADGARRLQAELERLTQIERPKLAAAKDDPDARRRLPSLDQQIQHLHQSLETAVVVAPPSAPWEQVRFGATVATIESVLPTGAWMWQRRAASNSEWIAPHSASSFKQVEAAVRAAERAGIRTVAFFMFGLPGESEADMDETIEFAKRLEPTYASFNVATPYPGTAFFESV